MSWIDDRIEAYYQWLKDNTAIKEDTGTGWFSISTPFIGLFNDNIEIFIKKEGDKIILSDDSQTIENLTLLGVDVNRSSKRMEFMKYVLRNYGIQFTNKELTVTASEKDFPQKKHALISAISEISDLDITTKHTVASVFIEDVQTYLVEQDVIFTPQFIVKGSTGLEFNFDFHIAGKKSELVIKPFNSLNQGSVERFLFSWQDIRDTRESVTKKEMKSLAIINDTINEPKKEYIEAFKSKHADVLFWSLRNTKEYSEKLNIA